MHRLRSSMAAMREVILLLLLLLLFGCAGARDL
jgi:hypothetical protein